MLGANNHPFLEAEPTLFLVLQGLFLKLNLRHTGIDSLMYSAIVKAIYGRYIFFDVD